MRHPVELIVYEIKSMSFCYTRRLQGQLRDVEGEAGSGDPAQHRVHQRHHPHHRHGHDRRRAALGSRPGKLTRPWTHLFDCHDCRRQRHLGHREAVNEGTNNTSLAAFPTRSCARFCHMFLKIFHGLVCRYFSYLLLR